MTELDETVPLETRRREILARAMAALAAMGISIDDDATAAEVVGAPAERPGRVGVEQRGGVLLIEMRWPEGRNRLDAAMIVGLGRAYYQLEHDDALQVGLLCATGPDFCAGLDVASFVAAQSSGLLSQKESFIDPYGLRPPYRTKPLVAAAHGRTQSGGHELFLCADIRVAASDTLFGQLEVTRGAFPGGGATVRFPREAGWANAMRYMLTGDSWGPEEAMRMGLVQAVTPPGRQVDTSLALAKKVAAAAPLGVRATFTNARQALFVDETAALAAVQRDFARILQTADAKEGQRAQKEGRAPLFRGL
jgi:enoyl-CoA hydratase/carnithine racemase